MLAPRAELRFFLDRGLGSRVVPARLRAAGRQLTTMDERYGVAESQNVSDVDWIEDATNRGEILLSKDLAIAGFLLHQEAIFAMADRAEGPYVV